jgi:tungstate transport system ATP-binding protein
VTAAYTVDQVQLSYGGPPVLSVDRLEVRRGEIVALVGPNGSGKTTLLHALAFLLFPDKGRLLFFGEPVSTEGLVGLRRRVGLLLQNPYLFQTSVMENVTAGLRLRRVPRAKSREAALAALDHVGLAGFENRGARSLSGGESQRVALARALVLDPEVLLLDEPGNHMDRASIQRCEEIVRRLNRERGLTVVLTTHNTNQAEVLAHRVLRLEDGAIFPA